MGKNDVDKIEKPISVKLYLDQLLNNKNNFEKSNNGHLNLNYNYKDTYINMKKTGEDISYMNKNASIENGIKISKVNEFFNFYKILYCFYLSVNLLELILIVK
jgi:hypothetical protein